MAVATRSRKHKTQVEAFRTDAGELHWRCPDCRSEHHESKRACGCGRVRPKLETLIDAMQAKEIHDTVCPAGIAEKAARNGHARAVGLENGRTAWQCRGCGTFHPPEVNACSICVEGLPASQTEAAAKEAAVDARSLGKGK